MIEEINLEKPSIHLKNGNPWVCLSKRIDLSKEPSEQYVKRIALFWAHYYFSNCVYADYGAIQILAILRRTSPYQSINQTSIAPISPAKPGSVAQKPNHCSTGTVRCQKTSYGQCMLYALKKPVSAYINNFQPTDDLMIDGESQLTFIGLIASLQIEVSRTKLGSFVPHIVSCDTSSDGLSFSTFADKFSLI